MSYVADSEFENNSNCENIKSLYLKQFITNNNDNESISCIKQKSEESRKTQLGSEKEKTKNNNSKDSEIIEERMIKSYENNIAWKAEFNKNIKLDVQNFWKRNYVKFNKEYKNNNFEEKWNNILKENNNNKELYWKEYLEKLIKYSEEKCYDKKF